MTLHMQVRRARNALSLTRRVVAQTPRWARLASTPARRDGIAVSYGVERMPGAGDVVFGGAVKFQLLNSVLPNAPRDFNALYLGSSAMPLDAAVLARLAARRGAPFVWNQNGVAYPGWYGDGWELVNAPRARLLHRADHVVYQSAFCKLAADRFYGAREGGWEILHNPVDTVAFAPAPVRPQRPLTLLLGGNQYQRYRLERALDAFAIVRSERHDARLLVAGSLSFAPDGEAQTAALVAGRGLEGAVELVGTYTQSEAPGLLRRADILIHPKYNDPCPTVVLEAMACGLPVVYSASGGTPELVGADAGVGIDAPLDWDQDHPPVAADLAAAALALADDLDARSLAARERSKQFDARAWIARHEELFGDLIRRRRGLS